MMTTRPRTRLTLPTHDECWAKYTDKAPLTALERFIVNNEPVKDEDWRAELLAALEEVRAIA